MFSMATLTSARPKRTGHDPAFCSWAATSAAMEAVCPGSCEMRNRAERLLTAAMNECRNSEVSWRRAFGSSME